MFGKWTFVLILAFAMPGSCKRSTPQPPSVAELVAQLSGPESRIGAKELVTEGDRAELLAHLPALIVALGHNDYSVRSSIAEAIGRVGPAAIPALREVLAKGPKVSQQPALEALRIMGPTTIPDLREALTHENDSVRDGAQFALVSFGAAALPTLIDALRSDETDVILRAAETIHSLPIDVLNAGGPAFTSALTHAIAKSTDRDTLRPLMQTISKLGKTGQSAVLNVLRGGNSMGIDVALEMLTTVDLDDRAYLRSVTSAILPHLRSNTATGRLVCRIIERLGSEAQEALPALIQEFKNRGKRRATQGSPSFGWPDCPGYALAKVGSAAVAPAVQLLSSNDRWVQYQALQILQELGTGTVVFSAAMIRTVESSAAMRDDFLRGDTEATLLMMRASK